ncbi:MAG: hypothetical protein Q4G52_07875 [Clostridia bacterium]|nr:hypothetical protein [Clostridia bacterium]
MTQAWYQVASLLYGYLAAGIILAIVLLGARKMLSDRNLWRRVRRALPQAVGTLSVLSAGNRRLSAGTELPVPSEGTLGSAHSCDVCIPYKGVHMRSAFFWLERDELHMVALHRDGFMADDVPVEPGDEAVLRDGAVLRVGELKLALRMNRRGAPDREVDVGPYVTPARRTKAQQGHGDGIGAPGRGEIRREKKLLKQQKKHKAR